MNFDLKLGRLGKGKGGSGMERLDGLSAVLRSERGGGGREGEIWKLCKYS